MLPVSGSHLPCFGPATVLVAASDLTMILSEMKTTRAEFDALHEDVARERAIDRRRITALEREEPQPCRRTGARYFAHSWRQTVGRCWRRMQGRGCICQSHDFQNSSPVGNESSMPHGQITSLTKANKNSESQRKIVPSSVIRQFYLNEGDKLRWQFATDKNGIFNKIEPVKPSHGWKAE